MLTMKDPEPEECEMREKKLPLPNSCLKQTSGNNDLKLAPGARADDVTRRTELELG